MLTTSAHSVPSGADRSGQPAWRRLVAVVLIALLSPVPALLAFWADADSDGAPDTWIDPSSGAVFTLSELDSFSWDIDGDGLANAQELQLGTNPFVADTDGDGLWDAFDPLPLDSSNSSQANGIVWGAFAMDDADGDGTPNFTDADPYGAGGPAVDPDSDDDGIPDLIDPAPGDPYNISPTNGFPWMGDALADADGDGVVNFHDWYPYDASRWDAIADGDHDGIPDGSDPNPNDSSNYSFANGISWGADAFGDSDADGIANFYDAYPYDNGNGYVPSEPDADGDGIPDSSDPSPWDHDNYSAANGVSWQGDARGDADNDGIANFYDQFPNDYYNGNIPVFDQDSDGIPDGEDPAPTDPTNLSPINGGLWYTAALADADGDGNPNFTDPWPYDPTNGNLPPEWDSPSADTDADGIPNAQDPALADPLNFSIYNGTSWHADAVGDVDGDGIVNFQDAYPYDYYNGGYAGPDSDADGIPDSSDPYPNDQNNGNGDADGDGIMDSQDPYPYDATNGSGSTGGGGDPQPEPDTDGDGRPDSQDPYPNDPYDNADFDQDGIPDVSDPAQADANNLSPINGIEWFGDVRGDADEDGVQNFWDLEPYGPPSVDGDGDGLIDSVDPAPEDFYNFSPHNGAQWQADALGDFDGDGVPNFFDAWPDDRLNGQLDTDMDGIPDPSDPAPEDSMNYSSYNGRNWYGSEVLGDADNDGILNFFDLYPEDFYNGNPPVYDSDRDGIPDNIDPDPGSPYNSSPNNGIEWGADAFGDADGDGTANYWDSDPYPMDTDGDGLADSDDPAQYDPYNYSTINYRAWPGVSALEDLDNDGHRNFFDPEPEGGPPREPDLPQPSASASPLVILNDGFDELGVPPAEGVTPKRDLEDGKLVIKAGVDAGKMATKGLTPLHLAMPDEYLSAGGSVTISKTQGEGAVLVHAVRTKDNVAEEHVVPFGSPYVPRAGGGWEYWIEGVMEGPVTLRCHFPQKTYGTNSRNPYGVLENPYGVMEEDADFVLQLKVCSAHLSVDRDRDGVISPGSYADTTFPGRPFRFWVNDDNDGGSIGIADIPGSSTPDGTKAKVQGLRDLVDFFPVYLDIKQLLTVLPPGPTIRYKMKQAEAGLRFVYTDLSLVEAASYLKDFAAGDALKDADAHRMTSEGYELNTAWLDWVKNDDKGVILVEGRNATEKPMVLSVETDRGDSLVELRVEVGIAPVETMFRHLNLHDRGLPGLVGVMNGGAAQPESMGDPVGFPDNYNSDERWLIFVHGFNVGGQASRGWNAEMFKRCYWGGNKARFVGVSWFGNPDDPAGPFPADYHRAVRNAFATAPALAQTINNLPGSPSTKSIFSHSLGCGVVSSSIADHGMNIGRVCFVDAALARECFDGRDPNVFTAENDGMTPAAWKPYDPKLYASNWYALFDSATDARGRLTWNNRFTRTDGGQADASAFVYNFYSSTENVLADYAGEVSSTALGALIDAGWEGKYAWAYQEKAKGNRQDYSVIGMGSTHVGSRYGGWGFNLTDPEDINDPVYYTVRELQVDAPISFWYRVPLSSVPGSDVVGWQAQFRRVPLFDPGYGPDKCRYGIPARWIDNSVLRGPNWITQLYDTASSATGGGAVVAMASNQNQLLAEAIPSLTWAVGAHEVSKFRDRNFNLTMLVDVAHWPNGRSKGVPIWMHSDIREVAYIYQHSVFKKIINISNAP